jgi:2'-hydroxyisoflavone reductase
MGTTRREFVMASSAAGSVLVLGSKGRPESRTVERAPHPLRILILGGTGFIGPHEVRYALARGHTVTLFNRGVTNPHLFPELEKLTGDRDNDLEALRGREWDVVIDNPASIPRWVRQSAGLLSESADLYLFVSTLSVIADNGIVGADESVAVATIEDPTTEEITTEEVTGRTYGALKALCEQEAAAAFPGRALIVRPGLIVGPGDRSDRFTYWPVRIDRGGEVLAPGDPSDPNQIIDARDLTGWMIRMLEQGHTGVYNATGPIRPLQMAEMLYGIRAVTAADVSFTWVDADFLEEHGVRAWSDMPTWIPPRAGMEGFSTVDCSKAVAAGLTFRPLAETSKDTLDWFKTLPEDRRSSMRAGIDAGREREVLAAWHRRAGL